MSRVGQILLWVGGLVLAALMVYTVALDLFHSQVAATPRERPGEIGVEVFYPERILWQEFGHGMRLCVEKGLAEPVEESENSIVIATALHKRRIRFTLHDVRGLRETKDEIRGLLERDSQPLAFVGSSNTVLTEAIADALRVSAGPDGGKGPVLLVPWASAVLTDRPEPGEGPVTLLDILPGRTFRFCPNNQHQSDLLVNCLMSQDANRAPRRVVLVVDRHDPFSVDLAACFHRTIDRVAPDAEIIERADSLGLSLLTDPGMSPGPAEEALAESIWRDAGSLAPERTTWVVLPLQAEPTLRMINALRRHARRSLDPEPGPLRVICGDGIGFTNLATLAGHCPFPVWCTSSVSAPAAAKALGKGMSPDTQIPAEIVASLVQSVDRVEGSPLDSSRLRDALAALRVDATSPGAMGRSLAFSRSGERVGDDLGHVLSIRPECAIVFARSRETSGQWSEPLPLESATAGEPR